MIKEDSGLNPTYIWGFVNENDAIYVSRSVGENKVFIYNPQAIKKTDYVKGKLKVLKNINKNNFDDLFDQKAVFDYFYKKLWDLRLDLGREIRDKNDLSDNIALMEAQHIIDRIIFTYFVCEKDLVSIKGHGPITGKQLFSDIIVKMDDSWNYLKMLFFEQFAKEDSEDFFCGKNVFLEVKYLNGGLFREKELSDKKIKETNLEIDYEWQNIFDILNKYTWIIEDEIPDFEGEYEGNLTPEIIGHIYEKFVISLEELTDIEIDKLNTSKSGDLKKGNKKIGAYYTPEHITDYISRNTINPYLFDNLKTLDETDFDLFLDNANKELLQSALEILDNIKICDPAAGSGAFLIKAGEVLLEYKLRIINKLNSNSIDRYTLKKDIIIQNLYGVDIQEGAIEICKLRLWLWLISSANCQNVEPLPNIEYNFVVGNSLVGWTKEKLNQRLLVHIDENHIKPLITLKTGYKSEQRKTIDSAINLLKKTDIQSYAKALSYLKSLYSYSSGFNAEILKEVIEWTRSAIYERIDSVFYDYIKNQNVKILFKDYLDLGPIHWKVDFNEIFEEGGFDVVLGNPPYVRHQRIVDAKKYLKFIYSTFEGRADLYVYFFERGINILNNNGYLSFICSDKFTKTGYGKNLRVFLLKYQIVSYDDYTNKNVFLDASVDPCVITIKKSNAFGEYEIIVDNNYKLPLSYLTENSWVFEDPKVLKVKEKIENAGVPLKDLIPDIKKGILTGYNKAFTIDKSTKDQLISRDQSSKDVIKPMLRGKDIKRWVIEYNDLYLLYIPKGFPIDNYPAIKEHLIKFEKDLKARTEVINGTMAWFELRRFAPDYYQDFELPKIIYTEISTSLFATYNEDNYFMNNKGFMITSAKVDLKYLSCLLSSKALNFVFKLLSCSLNKETFVLLRKDIETLPIVISSESCQLIFSEKADKLLESNNNLLNETKSFKNWLIEFFGIKNLSKKLDKYYDLSFDTFITELKKKNVHITDDNYHLLKNKFDKSQDIVVPLINKIKIIDKEIDEMVYDIYGLTDDEIQIIENMI